MSEPLVLVTQSGAVPTLALNRPAALNSLTAALHAQLRAALEAAAAACDVRCVVITGMGRAFCAGQDLNDIAAAPASGSGDPAGAQAQALGRGIESLHRALGVRIPSIAVAVLAAVNVLAAGVGAWLAMGCDLVLAARSASFIMAFSKIGL